jgi:2-polyprenyl-3-methyl-5-hydroxy-6-metoxy-1,4-benzoquinol methylase/uncharacterized protein YbaR (Trm112 family)
MLEQTLALLRCPIEGSPLEIAAAIEQSPDGECIEGVLRCPACRRWFRVEKGIADLVRDALREDADEKEFLRRHAPAIPEDILNSGIPVSLTSPPIVRSADDQRIVDEGRHWGRFMRRFWDVDDRSIFDLSIRGQHPRFYVAGILERDDRDMHRKYAAFPTAAGDVLFTNLGAFEGRVALDLGTGGGQFALAYARQGMRTIGIDPSFEELEMARAHARSQGIWNIDYVRAEPATPPIARGSVEVLLAKDSLHHVPDLQATFERAILPLLAPGASCFIQEHVGKSGRKRAVLSRIGPPLIRKMRRRYPKVDIPEELLRDSANEDVSMAAVQPTICAIFDGEAEFAGAWMYLDVEALVYFAFGKRRWFASLAKGVAWAFERVFLAGDVDEYWSFRGRLKSSKTPRGN